MIESAEDRHILQQDLDQLSSWVDTWQMTFNVKKCYLMHVTSSRRKLTQHAYYMKGQELSNVDQNPYLGVILTHDLKWTHHIDHITTRGNRMLGFLRHNLRRCPKELKSKVYSTLVWPTLEYASPVWDPHERTNIDKLEKVQRSAARVVFDKPHKRTAENQESVTALINDLEWPSLEERCGNARLVSMYKLLHGLVCIPAAYYLKELSSHTQSGARKHLE